MDDDSLIDNYEHVSSQVFYTCQNLPGPGIDKNLFQSQLCVRCDCVNFCDGACKCLSSTSKNYTMDGRLLEEKLSQISPSVIECNSLCSCSEKCGNRLVQYGPTANLEVFPHHKKGNSLRTLKLLKKGDYICEYAGEVISKCEAKLRIKNACDTMNYIFVLKEYCGESSIIETFVDPTCIGNIGRYINHSCLPNSAIVPVRFDSLVPHLAVFATCDILPGREITLDYSGGENSDYNGVKPCYCGESNCKKFIPFDRDLL
ncbi:histone-lysine N-methyltransferase SETMAR [Lycorma delicatula]|uniref:histone-lysine N-methyltransferase SETMAR n=1 Tax=Lycorma delicatula TaxID=130591 RepID=UPI003F50E967